MDWDHEEVSDLMKDNQLHFLPPIRKEPDSFSLPQMELSKYTSLRHRRRFYPFILAVTTFVSLYLHVRKKARTLKSTTHLIQTVASEIIPIPSVERDGSVITVLNSTQKTDSDYISFPSVLKDDQMEPWKWKDIMEPSKYTGKKIGQKVLAHRNMGVAASSSSSSSLPPKKYDVFVSFRDSDIRRGFLSHLSKELRRKDIDVYVDDRVESRDDLSLAHVKAIEGSKISLVIFSKDYASSKWCLEELVKIMQCKEVNEQIVIPVFFNIDPSDVRHQKGNYRDAFAQHEQKFMVNRLQIWRSALYGAANLRGYPYSNFESESRLIENIVKEILENLNLIRQCVSVSLIGIGQHLAKIESLLKMETSAVQIIGIWGMGGMGKTTIARALYDKFSSQYERCCFLENVREESETYGLSYLGRQLLSELLEEKSTFLKEKLSRKKVLIVLDDVSSPKQLEYLVKEQIPLGSNSRVIITSRDRDVLVSVGVHAIHEIEGLDFAEAFELFCLNAFKRSYPVEVYKTLSERIVDSVGGIPLALKVLGSFLHSQNKETWESMLRKLMKYPNKQIQNVLRLSYDGLDDVQKDILLDIAFFHNGKFKSDVARLLGEPYFASKEIDRLLNKAFIIIFKHRIEMHDLIQELCWKMVHERCKDDLGRLTRLRDNEKVYELLKNNKGTNAVKGILLNYVSN